MTEPASLLPMARFECQKLVLVGDPKQLSPTIQGSEPDHEVGLEQTLFDRLIKMGYEPTLLRTQYRCHPTISAISNTLFYGKKLLDGVTSEDRSPIVEVVPTLCFYNVARGKEKCGRDGSYYNDEEAKFVVFLIERLLESGVEPAQIGVITLYKSQLNTISNHLTASRATSNAELKSIQISTVDAFQGGEKDLIILSCVRTDHIGFIDCDRRTNVALTRAKRHLLIVGNLKILSCNNVWGKVIEHCRGKNRYILLYPLFN
ncbi:protein ZGRF1-like [Pocillopora damicornis]|uniref:protein ZGRF1-like n=1 Tax=Pocillopora damicornis TaxID=46731 RepID=UPI000F54F605|nr:protein ZGRF1-like [Pocillopora damicornis]